MNLNKKLVILISGKIKSGKNVAAQLFEDNFKERGFKVLQDYFAKCLKDYCKEDFKILAKVLENYTKEFKTILGKKLTKDLEIKIDELKILDENWYENKTFITRSILQILGTEVYRNRFKDTYWVELMKEKCEKSEDDVICISDCRFPSEIYGLNSDKYDIITVRLLRDPNKGTIKHSSETSLDDFKEWNYIIDNRRNNLKSFEKQIKMTVSDILKNFKINDPKIRNNILEPHKNVENFI